MAIGSLCTSWHKKCNPSRVPAAKRVAYSHDLDFYHDDVERVENEGMTGKTGRAN